ncbi:hypothetical protein HYDPIDRAFT_106321 [Hydnomerulius pinastri MD-312]|nr:hypothetical protein HYDPIDRAFT_106321 [Hydnomerulius pinastri MD-312]
MSQTLLTQAEEAKPVLTASVRDVRYFTALLRGINFSNRASVTLTADTGMVVTVEEARSLLATSYIYPDHFDEWSYTAPLLPLSQPAPSPSPSQSSIDSSTSFEIPLGTLIECLNIFGSANMGGVGGGGGASKGKKWRRDDDVIGSDDEHQGRRGNASGNGRLETYFGAGGGNEKRTSMRLTYVGSGHPLTLLLAEDSSGPTTTCEIATFDPEPNIELPFDGDQTVLKIIFKSSSWLRDALSELDPSCEKITLICNPPADSTHRRGATSGGGTGAGAGGKPLFRIKASGAFGSTEMDYPNDREVLETFECARSVSVSYRQTHITRALRALASSTKTSLRIEESGLLSMQFLVPVPKGKGKGGTSDSFIEFRSLALDEEVGS